eukprot:Sspe_Gene.39229::Locus_18927_Transcript_1_1_Confidence_1.000_Length_2146::g.39229::m.39229
MTKRARKQVIREVESQVARAEHRRLVRELLRGTLLLRDDETEDPSSMELLNSLNAANRPSELLRSIRQILYDNVTPTSENYEVDWGNLAKMGLRADVIK